MQILRKKKIKVKIYLFPRLDLNFYEFLYFTKLIHRAYVLRKEIHEPCFIDCLSHYMKNIKISSIMGLVSSQIKDVETILEHWL